MQRAGATRAEREILHGQWLADHDAEKIWGWNTPAGQLRARRRAALISSGAGLRPGLRVLEVGCGTGLFTALFAATGATILAVDISADLLQRARARGLPESQVTFCEKRFEDCDVDGPFDAIIGSSVLHHLEFDRAIGQIKALLKPGGVISFAEPNMLNSQVYLERRFSHLPIFRYVSPDETAFFRWRLAHKVREAGFRDVHVRPFDWLHPFTPKHFIRFVQGVGRLMERTPLMREFSGSLHLTAKLPNA